MSTSSKNVMLPSIPQAKVASSPDAIAREARNISGQRSTATTTTTSAARRVAYRSTSAQQVSATPKTGRTQGGTPSSSISRTSSKKGVVKKTRKNSKNNRPNSMNKGTIRLTKLTAPSFDATSVALVDKRTTGASVPLAYKKIMIR